MSVVKSELEPAFRPMLDSDIASVMAIEEEVYSHGWTEGIFHDCLRVHYSCWVMLQDEQIIGYGVISVAAGEAHILNIAVTPSMQGRGYGRQCMNFLLETARHHGADTVFLEVRPSNHSAFRLYDSLGFNQVGVRYDYYPAGASGREDAIILALPL
ncbi:MAG: ribosomal protein S18-alanine N-acetyltransferase [Gammaproteobacteria bacterium]|nr:ribosomal protein S18-alanine N-acetyltransferase [Gammaproteobacteria bacterium]MCW8928092.1 ribosomal protein S18-alanine N-acetyltransferase [Gammaproteobacteria bacterium]MCW8959751.1 ribosomal protein S18-alanine N-acetyltransferase [Gammaproteobacteria bacterium]MCW8972793.1 ribosomal protein S18-alanine N-acetyltransferase [Gammaproteobacteria bacterium]MCW8993719.1 ribosomal protein S18-alanine N-acetyltransferase [Gammaproteobacteria bacterium]